MIYEDAEERYRNVQGIGRRILEDALRVIYPGSHFAGDKGELRVVDLLPNQERCEVVAVPKGVSTPTLSQLSSDGAQRYFAHGVKAGTVQVTHKEGVVTMRNGLIKLEIKDGRIASVYDEQEG